MRATKVSESAKSQRRNERKGYIRARSKHCHHDWCSCLPGMVISSAEKSNLFLLLFIFHVACNNCRERARKEQNESNIFHKTEQFRMKQLIKRSSHTCHYVSLRSVWCFCCRKGRIASWSWHLFLVIGGHVGMIRRGQESTLRPLENIAIRRGDDIRLLDQSFG